MKTFTVACMRSRSGGMSRGGVVQRFEAHGDLYAELVGSIGQICRSRQAPADRVFPTLHEIAQQLDTTNR